MAQSSSSSGASVLTEATLLNAFGQALWLPRPTKTDQRARQLACALGYPLSWRVVRTITAVNTTGRKNNNTQSPKDEQQPVEEKLDHHNQETKKSGTSGTTQKHLLTTEPDLLIVDRIYAGPPGTGCDMWFNHAAAMKAAESWYHPVEEKQENEEEEDEDDKEAENNAEQQQSKGKKKKLGAASGSDAAAAAGSTKDDTTTTATPRAVSSSTPFDSKGGHLLPPQPSYQKGDKVQVYYDDQWWDAKILRVRVPKGSPLDFRYQVQYAADHTKQSGVAEEFIRERGSTSSTTAAPAGAASAALAGAQGDDDPSDLAVQVGLGPDWQAVKIGGNNRWKIAAPNGNIYMSKAKALQAYHELLQQQFLDDADGGGGNAAAAGATNASGATAAAKAAAPATAAAEGDPPWRTTGNEYLGRKIFWTTYHQASARRKVTIEQIGTVRGWISETDVDSSGAPGFTSETTGQPARLYNVVFDDPNDLNHPYYYHLIREQDVEEDELLENLIPPEDLEPSTTASSKKKKQRTE